MYVMKDMFRNPVSAVFTEDLVIFFDQPLLQNRGRCDHLENRPRLKEVCDHPIAAGSGR